MNQRKAVDWTAKTSRLLARHAAWLLEQERPKPQEPTPDVKVKRERFARRPEPDILPHICPGDGCAMCRWFTARAMREPDA